MATEGMKNLERLNLRKVNKRLNELFEMVWPVRETIQDVAVSETMEHLSLEDAKNLKYKTVEDGFLWGKPWSTAWFRLRFEIPESYKGQAVSLLYDTEGECIIFRDDKPVQGLDVNHKEYLLTSRAKGGEQIELYVEAGASDAFGNFKRRCMHAPKVAIFCKEMWSAYCDTISLRDMVHIEGKPTTGEGTEPLDGDSTRRARIIYELSKAVDVVDYQDKSVDAIRKSGKRLSKALKPLYDCKANASEQTVAVMGHAHIDVAWLWPLAETKRKCGRSFSNVLELLDHYKDYVFCQSQPHLYEFTKERYPSLYKRIKQKVKTGNWIPTGSAWVEMDCNVTGGESLVRQMLFGMRFFEKEFDYTPACLWLPDVFGYSAALPQILKRCGLDNFLTQKISWNQFTTFPHHSFYWEGIDGTQVLSHFLPGDTYNDTLHPAGLMTGSRRYRQKDRSPIHANLHGFGDGGGGPTKLMAERIKRYSDLEGVPKTEPMSPADFFERLESESKDLPTWVGELYLEFHRGTLTTMCANKRDNRKCELLLRDIELLAGINAFEEEPYPQEKLYDWWKTVLLNQFHDIIPGSSIEQVYKDSETDYRKLESEMVPAKEEALANYAQRIDTVGEGQAIVAFNSLSWERSDVAVAEIANLKKNKPYVAVNGEGISTPAQVGEDGKLRFLAPVLSMGHATYFVREEKHQAAAVKATKRSLENELVRVKLDAKGCITSIFDKKEQRESIDDGKKANQFQLFEDKPATPDAWDIDIFYNDKLLDTDGKVESIDVVETGPVRSVIRIKRNISKSTISQDVVLSAGSKRVDFHTTVDWNDEKEVLLKVAFPVAIRNERARYEIQFGNVTRPTHWNTPRDFARFEVVGHKWVDLSETGYGVAMLNDCKYGHDVRDGVMRLTLLRATTYPNPVADVNMTHRFTYSILPHTGDYTNGVVRSAYELNAPTSTIPCESSEGSVAANLSNFSVSEDNVIIETVKKAEDSEAIIVRLYEAHGKRGPCTLNTTLPVSKAMEVNMLEKDENVLELRGGEVKFNVKPFDIRTIRLDR